jgi:hypothetical protein
VIEQNDASAGPADPPHLVRDANGIGHHADEVRRVDNVEDVVGELQIRGVHLQQTNVADVFALRALARDLEHRLAEVDTSDGTLLWIE